MSQGNIVVGLSNADYHAHPAVGKSCLDQIARSPFHYFSNYVAEDRPPRESSNAQKLGSLAHCVILEPDEVLKRYAVKPDDCDMRTKAGKEWAASVAPGFEVISSEQLKAAESMRWSLLKLPDVASALATGAPELSIFATFDEYHIDAKIRPDWVHECDDGGVILVDVKTCADASPREFGRSAANYRYHVQAAFYSDVYAKATGRKVHAFAFACVESAYPYAAACYVLDDAAMIKGRLLFHTDLRTLAHCLTYEHWPAFGEEMQLLALPAWAA